MDEIEPLATLEKDPGALLDYSLDWRPFVGDDPIETATWTVEPIIPRGGAEPVPALTVSAQSVEGNIATVWFTGGTRLVDYLATCAIVTEATRRAERTILIRVLNL